MHITEAKFKEFILKTDLVKEEEFQTARDEAFRTGRTIQDVLIGRGALTEEYIVQYLEPYFLCPVIDLRKVTLDTNVVEMLPESFSKGKNLLVFEFDPETRVAKVAMLDPFDLPTLEYLRFKLRVTVEPYLTFRASLRHGLKSYKQKIGEEFNKVIEENIARSVGVVGKMDPLRMAEEVPIIAILDSILEHAITMNASDIHFEPFSDKLLVRYRIEGIMHEILSLPALISPILVARVKILANMQTDIHNAPQDGRFRFEVEDQKIDLRVSVIPTFHGEKAEMRLLMGSSRPLSLTDLGLLERELGIIKESIKKTHGMILVTGPTGNGKTTTLYAILHLLNTPKVSIATIEDPVEYDVARINQTQVNVKSGITFANGLRSLVRQNPDIIMIGEIRDSETADIAVNAALTGHLVLSTLHTNDAGTAVPRLVDMGVPNFLLASTLNTVVAQRLVRKICNVCIESYKPTEETRTVVEAQLKSVQAGGKKITLPDSLYQGKGCKLCSFSGFRGQIGIFEILTVSPRIREMIMHNASGTEVEKAAREEGMITMFEDGFTKVQSGITTVDEVLRVIRE